MKIERFIKIIAISYDMSIIENSFYFLPDSKEGIAGAIKVWGDRYFDVSEARRLLDSAKTSGTIERYARLFLLDPALKRAELGTENPEYRMNFSRTAPKGVRGEFIYSRSGTTRTVLFFNLDVSAYDPEPLQEQKPPGK